MASTWQAVSDLAWWRLKHADWLTPTLSADYVPRLCYWENPCGFSMASPPPSSLTVLVVPFQHEIDPLVHKAVWDEKADHQRLLKVEITENPPTFEPTITLHDALLDAEERETIFQPARQLRVPLICREDSLTITEDGGIAGMELRNYDRPATKVALEWCDSERLNDWQEFFGWVQRLRGFLRRQFDGVK